MLSPERNLFRRLLLAALLLPAVALHAGSNSAWQVRVWQAQGLTDSNIRAVTQTTDGFVWVATSYYCARFDGVQFEKVYRRDLGGLTQRMHLVLAGRDGSLWFAFEDGAVAHLESGGTQIFTNNLSHVIPRTLVEDAAGGVWASYNRGPVCLVQNGKAAQVPLGIRDDAETVLTADRQGRVWFVCLGQIGLCRDGNSKVLLHLGTQATRLAAASDGGIWICSGLQLLKYKPGEKPQDCGMIKVANPAVRPTALLEDADGTVWIGTQTGGLFHYDGSHFENVPTSHRTINGLMQDREGNLWAATGAGLTRVRPRAITVEGGEAGLPSEAIQSPCEDTTGVLWASTKDGTLVRRDGDSWKTIPLPNEQAFGPVNRVAPDPTGGIWVGTRHYNLHRWKNGAWTDWDPTNGLSSHTVTAICVTRNGEAWVAGGEPISIAQVQPGKIQFLSLPPKTGRIWAMAEDPQGKLWAVGDSGTLLCISNGLIADQSIRDVNGLIFRCLLVADDGAVWFGSNKRGLARSKNGRLNFITTDQGLPSDHISQIVADQQGWLWLGTDEGISKVRLAELNAVADGQSVRLQPVRPGQPEDLASLHPTSDDWNSAIRTHDGKIWMSMGQGLVVIDPRKLRDDSTPPNVLIRRVQADDRTLVQYGEIAPVDNIAADPAPLRVPASHGRLEFDFTALSFSAPENVRFLFQLAGIDNHWIDANGQRSASYSRLPPGHYLFRVKACNSDGLWNKNGASVAFIVTPFMWQQWWFRLAVLLLFTGTLIAIVRYVSHRRLRLRLLALQQKTAVEKERSRIARDLHDDLGSQLTQVVFLSELFLHNRIPPEETSNHAKQISTTVREIIQSLDETVWALNPRNDALRRTIDYIGQFAVDFTKIAKVRCCLDLPDHPPTLNIPVETRHNLFLAVKESLANALKHGNPTEIRLRISLTDDALVVKVEDDGCGFSISPNGAAGEGLHNMRNRMEEVNGRLEIQSTPGSGTSVTFTLPWRRG